MPSTLDAAWSRLTGAIVQLQTSIQAYKSSQRISDQHKLLEIRVNGYPTQHTTDTFILPTSDAQDSPATRSSLDNLEAQLATFEQQLKQRRQWRLPPYFSPDPFLLIDLSDLDDAIQHLQNAIDAPRFPQQAPSPQTEFSTRRWEWDFQWSEWYYEDPKSKNHIYLTEWAEDEGGWQMVAQGHKSVDEGLSALGCWEDWRWDEQWGEWYLPIGIDDEAIPRRRIYACEWRKSDDGNWVYVDRRATLHEEE